MCKYCDFYEYPAEVFPTLLPRIDKQNIEVYITDDYENECKIIHITGGFTQISIEIKFCPMCGKKL